MAASSGETKCVCTCPKDSDICICDCFCFMRQDVRNADKVFWAEKVLAAEIKVKQAHEDYTLYKKYVEDWNQSCFNLEKFGDYESNLVKRFQLKQIKIDDLYWKLICAIKDQQHYNEQNDIIKIRLQYFDIALMLEVDKKKIKETANVIFKDDVSSLIQIEYWKKAIKALL
jgi:hypothetical protein